MRRLIAVAAAMALFAAVLAGGFVWREYRQLKTELPVQEDFVFKIPAGSSMASVAARLASAGLIDRAASLTWYARFTGQAQAIKAGEYRLEPGQSAIDALQLFVQGEVLLHSVTLVEGWTTAKALAALQSHPAVTTTIAAEDQQAILNAVGATETHPEGLFLPDTYRFGRGTTDADILRQAYGLLQHELARAWSSRQTGIPLTSPYEALILASIIEKETARDDEREKIAGVFIRRLHMNMRLQTDPTVIYGLGDDYDGNIRRRDLSSDTPYNTYTRSGLPPTPIALAGAASIRAAVNPAPGSAVFFVATGDPDGSHYFSATQEEHEAAVARYLKKLRSRRKQ